MFMAGLEGTKKGAKESARLLTKHAAEYYVKSEQMKLIKNLQQMKVQQ